MFDWQVCDWKNVSRRYKDMHQIDLEELEKTRNKSAEVSA